MAEKTPYHIIKHQHVTEKANMLQELKNAKSDPALPAANHRNMCLSSIAKQPSNKLLALLKKFTVTEMSKWSPSTLLM